MKPSKKIMKEIIKELFYGYLSKIKIKVIEENENEGYYEVSFNGKVCCFNMVAKEDRVEVSLYDVDNSRYIGYYNGRLNIINYSMLWKWLFQYTVFD